MEVGCIAKPVGKPLLSILLFSLLKDQAVLDFQPRATTFKGQDRLFFSGASSLPRSSRGEEFVVIRGRNIEIQVVQTCAKTTLQGLALP
jgi:hypothetical protein